MSKQEAERLADALDKAARCEGSYSDWAVAFQNASVKLRQWPDGKPVAEVESWTSGSYCRNYKLQWFKDVPRGAKLYTVPADQSARIAELESQRDALQAEAQIAASVAKTNEDALRATLKQAREALEETWRILDAAGLLNLSNGVQLGPTVWYVKAIDAQALSRAAISAIDKVQPINKTGA